MKGLAELWQENRSVELGGAVPSGEEYILPLSTRSLNGSWDRIPDTNKASSVASEPLHVIPAPK